MLPGALRAGTARLGSVLCLSHPAHPGHAPRAAPGAGAASLQHRGELGAGVWLHICLPARNLAFDPGAGIPHTGAQVLGQLLPASWVRGGRGESVNEHW